MNQQLQNRAALAEQVWTETHLIHWDDTQHHVHWEGAKVRD